MAVIPVPANIGFDGCTIKLIRATQEHRSPFTGRRQVVTSAFALWAFEGKVVPLQGADAAAMRSFLVQLKGRANTFRLIIPASEYPISGYSGTQGLVNGANQSGTSINTDGWTINKPIFANGDYFNIGDELKMCTSAVASNGAGQATISFEPPLRNSPADNVGLNVLNPFIYLAAQDDEIAQWGLQDFNTHNMSIKATEAFE